jgi:hypothetical protein
MNRNPRRQVGPASTVSVAPSSAWWASRRAPLSRSRSFTITLSASHSDPHIGTACPLSLLLLTLSFVFLCSGTFRSRLHLPRIHCPCCSPPHFPRVHCPRPTRTRRHPCATASLPPTTFRPHLPSTSIEQRWGSSARMAWRHGPTHLEPTRHPLSALDAVTVSPPPFPLASLRSCSSGFLFEVSARLLFTSSLFGKEIGKKWPPLSLTH